MTGDDQHVTSAEDQVFNVVLDAGARLGDLLEADSSVRKKSIWLVEDLVEIRAILAEGRRAAHDSNVYLGRVNVDGNNEKQLWLSEMYKVSIASILQPHLSTYVLAEVSI